MADGNPHNLPVALSSFIGRACEVADVQRLLAETRLLTLTGVGGCGKTRVALAAAAQCVPQFIDGVWLVELAPLTDPSLVPQTLLTTLGMREQAGVPHLTTLVQGLRLQEILLVIDNCEHLIEATAQLADALLRGCPLLRILSTSREPLGVEGEALYPVPPLGTTDKTTLSLDELRRLESVQLFEARARAANPAFRLTAENAGALATICRRLEGIPLALELAAARTKAMTVTEVAARLDDALGLLKGGGRTTAARHQTMRAALDWSHALLSEAENVLFRRLAVFVGGWTLAGAEAVCGWDGLARDAVLDVLTGLVEKSLVVAGEQVGETRYRMLEPVRQYANDLLLKTGESEYIRSRHLDYCVAYAEQFQAHNSTSDQASWRTRMETDVGNMRTAIEWAIQGQQTKSALRLTADLAGLWLQHHPEEGLRHLAVALRLPTSTMFPIARARALYSQARVLTYQGNHEAARTSLVEVLEFARAEGDEHLIIASLNLLGYQLLVLQDHNAAQKLFKECLERSRTASDFLYVAVSLYDLGLVAQAQGDSERAAQLMEESLALWRPQGEKMSMAQVVRTLGYVYLQRREYERAGGHFRESLELNSETGDVRGVAICLTAMASLCVACNRAVDAVRLLGAAHSILEPAHLGVERVDQEYYASAITAARAELSPAAYDAAWAAGSALSRDEAIQAAKRLAMSSWANYAEPESDTNALGLTTREVEVLRWLARGLSDAEIAERLVLSVRTVNAHLRSIYSKLDVTTRTAAVRAAIDMKVA